MKNVKKIIIPVLLLVVFILLIVLVLKIIGGAAAIAKGIINFFIGLIVILITVGIVVWMFSYARKHRK